MWELINVCFGQSLPGQSRDTRTQTPSTQTLRQIEPKITKHAGVFTCYRNEKIEIKALILIFAIKIPTASRSIMRSYLPKKKSMRSGNSRWKNGF